MVIRELVTVQSVCNLVTFTFDLRALIAAVNLAILLLHL